MTSAAAPPGLAVSRPAWRVAVERLVERAAREVQPLAAMTPVAARGERERLAEEVRAGRRALPLWTYARRDHEAIRRALDAAERMLSSEGEGALDALLVQRVRELALEAALSEAAGTTAVGRLASERYRAPERALARAASALCTAWLAHPAPPAASPDTGAVPSDDPSPASLLSQMREAVGRLRLPFAVVATPVLASLAATGEGSIFVASGRLVAAEDATRTVLHEIEGHARPRARSAQSSLAILRAGTARGIDHQEGRALVLEERAGYLGPRRRRQLAARHRAVEAMFEGASFADVATTLHADHGLPPTDAVLVAERAFRGGDGVRPGLGRERVYLESYVRVSEHLAEHPHDEAVLACGQIAVEAIDALRAYAG